jgi:hypothetical protein
LHDHPDGGLRGSLVPKRAFERGRLASDKSPDLLKAYFDRIFFDCEKIFHVRPAPCPSWEELMLDAPCFEAYRAEPGSSVHRVRSGLITVVVVVVWVQLDWDRVPMMVTYKATMSNEDRGLIAEACMRGDVKRCGRVLCRTRVMSSCALCVSYLSWHAGPLLSGGPLSSRLQPPPPPRFDSPMACGCLFDQDADPGGGILLPSHGGNRDLHGGRHWGGPDPRGEDPIPHKPDPPSLPHTPDLLPQCTTCSLTPLPSPYPLRPLSVPPPSPFQPRRNS